MRVRRTWGPVFFLITALFAPNLHAEEPLPLPDRGDREMPGGKLTPVEYFAKKTSDTACRTDLGKAETAYKTKRSAETVKAFLKLVEKCGHCETRKIEHKEVQGAVSKEFWFRADGFCQIPGTVEGKKKFLEAAGNRLLTPKKYIRANGGYPHMVVFQAVGPTGLAIDESDEPLKKSPFYAYIAVQPIEGVKIFATYFSDNEFEKGKRDFYLAYKDAEAPGGYSPPVLGGRKIAIPAVRGRWVIDDEGFVRFSTKADFGVPPLVADADAQNVQLETMVRLLHAEGVTL